MRFKIGKKNVRWILRLVIGVGVVLLGVSGVVLGMEIKKTQADKTVSEWKQKTEEANKELETLKNEDQYKINEELRLKVEEVGKSYPEIAATYEKLINLREDGLGSVELEKQLAEAMNLLGDLSYMEASSKAAEIDGEITKIRNEAAVKLTAQVSQQTPSAPVNNTPPGNGYNRQVVETGAGNFTVSLVAADHNSTRVIVDTASGGDCGNDCPVLPLADFVARNGAFAGINGSYFCPASYPSCAGKTNSFDLLLMNKDKKYFNSDNNVYSSNPGVVFGDGYIRFLGSVSEWGRDTNIEGMISNYPLLVSGGEVRFGGDTDPKKGSKGNRSFVANKGNTVFIGVVHNATVAESALVMKAMGMENALNLDDGGSTALWSGGYKVGPGRNLANVILFVGK